MFYLLKFTFLFQMEKWPLKMGKSKVLSSYKGYRLKTVSTAPLIIVWLSRDQFIHRQSLMKVSSVTNDNMRHFHHIVRNNLNIVTALPVYSFYHSLASCESTASRKTSLVILLLDSQSASCTYPKVHTFSLVYFLLFNHLSNSLKNVL